MSAAAAGGGGGGGNLPPFTSPYNTRSVINELYSSRLPLEATSLIRNYTGNWWEDTLKNAMGRLSYDAHFYRGFETLPSPLEHYIKDLHVLDAYLAYLNSDTFKKIRGAYADTYKQRLLADLLKKTLHTTSLEHFKRIIDAGAVADMDILGSIIQMNRADKLAYLLSEGLDPNTSVSTFTRETLLSRAVGLLYYYNYFETAQLLLEAGATGARVSTEFTARKPPANANAYGQKHYQDDIRGILIILFILLVKEDEISDAAFAKLLGKISPEKMEKALTILMQLISTGKIIPKSRPTERFISLVTDSLGPEAAASVVEDLIRASSFETRKHALIAFNRARTRFKGGKRMRKRKTRRRN